MTPENDNLSPDQILAELEAYQMSLEGQFECTVYRIEEELIALRRMAPQLSRLHLNDAAGVNVRLNRLSNLFTSVIAAVEQESCPLSQSRRTRLDSLLPHGPRHG